MLLYPCGHSCWLPFVGKQLNKFVISRILYPAEDITKILYRIQFVISDIGEDGHEPRKAHAGRRAAPTKKLLLRYFAILRI